MNKQFINPLDTGQRIRRERRKRQTRKWVGRVLRNRHMLLVVLWVAKAIVQLARLISQVIDGS